jgi:hypothetical protein
MSQHASAMMTFVNLPPSDTRIISELASTQQLLLVTIERELRRKTTSTGHKHRTRMDASVNYKLHFLLT